MTDTIAPPAPGQAPDQAPGTGPIAGLGAIDCDVHPRSPLQADLMPFLDSYWRDMFPYRDINQLELTSYPTSTRAYRRAASEGAVEDAAGLARHHLDPLGLSAAILNVVNGTQAIYDPYMATALCQATNRWLAAEWLDRDPRLRAALLVPFQHPEEAAAEIYRYRDDRRFVQVLALCMGERPLGQRAYWPIYRAAADCGFQLSIHPGSAYRSAPTQAGFLSTLVEEQVTWTQGFATQVVSLLAEGVFQEFPEMKVVCAESGVSWLFGVSWRVSKDWRGARMEVPWIKEPPHELFQRQLRLTLQPFDGPPDPADALKAVECFGGPEMLLYSSDFPHDYPGPAGAWPAGLPADLAPAICRDNVLATYPRLEVTQ